MAALSLATDLGLGQPLEHELGVCLAALELADRLGCSAGGALGGLLRRAPAPPRLHRGRPVFRELGGRRRDPLPARRAGPRPGFGAGRGHAVPRPPASPTTGRCPNARAWSPSMLAGGQKRFELMAANLCEGGRLLARRLHLPDEVARALGQVTARWDGKGVPAEVAGEEISRPLRIVRVAHDLVAIAQARDREAAIEALRRRRGRGYDPEVVDAALAEPEALLRAADVPDAWERVIAAEPRAGRDDLERGAGRRRPRLRRVHRPQGRLPARALGPGGRARGERPPQALGCSRAEVSRGPRRGLLPRPRPGGGAERDLGQARPAERRRVGAGAPSSLLHRARPRALRRARAARPARRLAPRAARRLRLPPRSHGRAARASARGCSPRPTPMTR